MPTLASRPAAGWSAVRSLIQLQPGDILAWTPESKNQDTSGTDLAGHLVLVLSTPVRVSGTANSYYLVVMDATATPHGPDDTRSMQPDGSPRFPWGDPNAPLGWAAKRGGAHQSALSGLGIGTIELVGGATLARTGVYWSVPRSLAAAPRPWFSGPGVRNSLGAGRSPGQEVVTMPVTRLNHAVLYVRDVERTRRFYEEALGFGVVHAMPGAAFLRAPGSTNDHDLGAFEIGSSAGPSTAGRGEVGLYHLAWEVDTLAELARLATVLREEGALVGASDHQTTKALYAKDPDGLEFEVCWIVPAEFLTEEILARSKDRPAPLDLAAEIERYGAETRGGVGVSIPTAS